MFTLLFGYLLALTSPPPQSVELNVTSTAAKAAPLHVAVFRTAEDFAADKPIVGLIEPMQDGRKTVTVELPAAGDYVFAAFHDLNDNGKLDRNFFGVPTEPYGFTKEPPSKWRSPEFGEVATSVGDIGRASIQLKRWNEY